MNIILWETTAIKHGLPRTLGTGVIASHLRQNGYSVKVISFCTYLTTDELVALTEKYMDDTTIAIGVSSTFWSNSRIEKFDMNIRATTNTIAEPQWVVDARSILENRYTKLDWLLGGPSGSYNESYFKFPWIRFQGYCEDEILHYANRKFNRDNFVPFVPNEYVKTQHETDFIMPYEWLPMELGRGCQFKCKFCAEPIIGKKKGTYIRSMECVYREIMDNYEKFGTTNYYFVDSTVNEDTDKIIDLANLVQKLPFKLNWVGFNRLDLIWSKPEQCSALKDSGLVSAYFGIESFHPKASMAIGKGFMGRHGKDFLCKLRDKWSDDITYTLSFIAGLPYETQDDIKDTMSWLEQNNFSIYSTWGALYLDPSDPSPNNKSDFSVNYGLYGYKFPNPNNPIYWENKHWTYKTAYDFISLPKKRVFGAFALGDVCGLGMDIKDVQHRVVDQEFVNLIQQKKKDHVRHYVQKSLEYKP
jgi:radical SAM superfamily enzyme YgiQ (UPF0313 family)